MTIALDEAAGPHQEVELKYAVGDEVALRAWLETAFDHDGPLSGIEAGPWTIRHDEDVYVDTDDQALRAAGYAARLRRRGADLTLAVKSLGPDEASDDALVQRTELEAPASQSLDPAEWPESEPRSLVQQVIGARPLRMRFVLQQRRAVQRLAADDASAELSLDNVRVRARDRVAGTFMVLEVEAIGEASDLLARVATALEDSGALRPEPRSKERIAAELLEPPRVAISVVETTPAEAPVAAPKPAKPSKSPGVRVDDSLGLAGRKVLGMHLERMLAAEEGTRSGEDPEDLHKMRVATRRMRAVWRVFDGSYRGKLQRRYVRELRSVAGALGAVRDLDVQLEGLAGYAKTLPPAGAAALEPFADELRRRRGHARDALITLLDGDEYADFVADYRDFVMTPGAGERTPSAGVPILVRDTAPGRIWLAYEHVRAHDTTLQWADVPALHALRIDAKRLRYTLESFRDVLPVQAEQLIARVVELQDHLGALNDADVGARLARDVLVGHATSLPAASREAMGHYLDAREAELARLRRTLPPVWRRMIATPYRRTLAFTVASI